MACSAPFSLTALALGLRTHMFCGGLPTALAVRRYGRYSRDGPRTSDPQRSVPEPLHRSITSVIRLLVQPRSDVRGLRSAESPRPVPVTARALRENLDQQDPHHKSSYVGPERHSSSGVAVIGN